MHLLKCNQNQAKQLLLLFLIFFCAPAFADYYSFQGGGGGGGGSGTVGNGNAGQVAYFQATGTTVIGNIDMNVSGGALTMGIVGTTGGSVVLAGSTSGTVTLQASATAGTGTKFQFPATNGSAGQFLQTDGTGITSWQTVSGSGTVTSVGFTGDGVVYNTSVTGAPVTTSGTFAPSLVPTSQYFFLGSVLTGSHAPLYQQVPYAGLTGTPAGIVIGSQTGSAGQFVTGANSSGVLQFGTPAGAVTSVSGDGSSISVSPTTGATVVSVLTSAAFPGSPTTTTQSLGDSSTKVATTAFTAAGLAALNPIESVDAATTTILPNTPTYNNGTAGVGATLTAGSNTTLTVDGFTGSAIGQYFLVKNQATSANNGIYQLTTVGSGSAAWVLTRAVNFNAPANMNHGSVYFVINGTSNISTEWGMTSSIVTVGSTSMTWVQMTVNPTTIQTNTLTDGTIWVGNVSNVATSVTMSGDVTITDTAVSSIGANKVTNAKFRQSGALSVVGNSTGSTANVADISDSAGGQILNSNNGNTALAWTAAPQLGVNGGAGGSILLEGSTSGSCIVQVAAAAGTSTVFQLPPTNGSAGQFLQSVAGTGSTQWASASGSGTVNSGTGGQGTYYATTGTAVSGNPNENWSTGTVTIGQNTSVAGVVVLEGGTSGSCTLQTAAAAGSTTFQFPGNNGTNGYYLQTNGSGITSWQAASGSGTVNSGTAGQGTYYASTGAAVSGNPNENWSTGTVTIGQLNTVAGVIVLDGGTSGTCTIQTAAAAGTTTFQFPANNGTSGFFLQTNGSGITSWQASAGGVASVSNSDGTLTISPTTGSVVASIASSVALAGSPTTTTQSASTNNTTIATTAYVTTAISNAISGINPAVAVVVATTSAANTSSLTYNNGVGGVGATFTGATNTAITFDGVTLTSLNQRVLVKNDTQSPSGAFNGIYTLTQLQTSLLPPILTRALDYDQPSDMNSTGAIPVTSGTVNVDTTWVLISNVATVGTSPLTYTQFSLNPSTIATTAGGTAGQVTYFATTGNAVSGSANFTVSNGAITLGQSGTAGSITLNGSSSGTCLISVAAAAGTGTVFQLPPTNGTSGNSLQTNGSGITSWGAVNLASTAGVTGNLPVTNLNSGTSASSTTFWCGNGTWATPSGGGGGSTLNGEPGGRLTLTTGVPVTTSNVTAATTIYWTPYVNDTSYLYGSPTASVWNPYTFTQYSATVQASLFRIMDVFDNGTGLTQTPWDSGGQTTGTVTGATAASPCVLTATNSLSVGNFVGIAGIVGTLGTDSVKGLNGKVCRISAVSGTTITLEGQDTTTLTYTSGGTFYVIPTSRTTAVSILQGHYAQASTNYLYLGTYMTTGTSGQTENSTQRRLVWNYFNRKNAGLVCQETAATYTFNGTTYRPADANTTTGVDRVELVCGFPEDELSCRNYQASGSTSNRDAGIGINSNVLTSATVFGHVLPNTDTGLSQYNGYPNLGYNFIQRIEAGASGANTYYGTNSSPFIQAGLQAEMPQ